MKSLFNVFLLSACLLIAATASAQIKTPAASPTAKLETTVGLTTVTVEYSRPSKNGREIYGNLVPYDALWRTGANKNTTIAFSDDVTIGGTEVKKGTYAIFTKPGKKSWEVYFYSATDNWGTPEKWDDAKVAAKVTATPVKSALAETFTINVGNVTSNAFQLELTWDETTVPVSIGVPTDKKVSANIEQVMAGPTGADYVNAARYYRESKKDLQQALVWMNKGIEMGRNEYWILRQKSLIEADLGDYKAAIATATLSLEKAKADGNNDYVKMNTDSIAEWSKK
jgi:hypothetical protein